MNKHVSIEQQAEAEELRRGIERLILEFDDHEQGGVRRALQELLDRVDARDSLSLLDIQALLRVENIALRKTNAELKTDFDTEHNHNHEQLERIDGLKVLLREVGSILVGVEFCNGDIPCLEECWQCRAAVVMQTIGDDIEPGPSIIEMTKLLTRFQEALIGIRNQSHESRPGAAWVHWREMAAQALEPRKKEFTLGENWTEERWAEEEALHKKARGQ